MLFLLDTNAISDLMRDHPSVAAKVAGIGPNNRVTVCPIVTGEILYGIARLPAGRKRSELQARADGILASISCDPIPPAVGNRYASIKWQIELAGTPVDDNDLWIAATAAELGATLVTRDHAFRHIATLVTEDWSV